MNLNVERFLLQNRFTSTIFLDCIVLPPDSITSIGFFNLRQVFSSFIEEE